ncbi:hypothetical protein LJ707_07900 [Mucilaginibacter sp. UR6-1]|uniref:hypothetical protein n=1 Tax=Mucilaginibacter sp. UR6-1 TaxID=1435643 RepID=UPI001E3256EE|nr:hypothetical protein [Mucilaginibacter sp. UR6-1]MCC8408849.1 hypothetical protein [Mucilaginibacter sp. UR6-1]
MMQEYINSGILEAYVLGCASQQEVQEVLSMKEKHPEVKDALLALEDDMEKLAASMAIEPPANLWPKIADEINEITMREPLKPQIYREQPKQNTETDNKSQYIDIESEATHMRIHKAWRWVFAAVFVLGKIFLGFAIYYYLENRQMNEQMNELKTELKQLKSTQ